MDYITASVTLETVMIAVILLVVLWGVARIAYGRGWGGCEQAFREVHESQCQSQCRGCDISNHRVETGGNDVVPP